MDLEDSARIQLIFINSTRSTLLGGDWHAWDDDDKQKEKEHNNSNDDDVMTHHSNAVDMMYCIEQYRAFFHSFSAHINNTNTKSPPPLLVPDAYADMVWLAHIVHIHEYVEDCKSLVGRIVDHDEIQKVASMLFVGSRGASKDRSTGENNSSTNNNSGNNALQPTARGKKLRKKLEKGEYRHDKSTYHYTLYSFEPCPCPKIAVPFELPKWGFCNKAYYSNMLHKILQQSHHHDIENSESTSTTFFASLPIELVEHIARFTEFNKPPSSPKEREECRYLIALTKDADRQPDMLQLALLLARSNEQMTTEERKLFKQACKETIGPLRVQLKKVKTAVPREERTVTAPPHVVEKVRHWLTEHVVSELTIKCQRLMQVIESVLLKEQDNLEAKLFFTTMLGAFYRYLHEASQALLMTKPNDQSDSMSNENNDSPLMKGKKLIDDALAIAEEKLSPINPIRLELALHRGYIFETKGMYQEAAKYVREAFDKALPLLDDCDEQTYSEATTVLTLMRDSAILWDSNQQAS